MVPRRERITRAEFPLILRNGRRRSSANFGLVISLEHRGRAVVVSKKTARLSVTRHRMKRRVLEALRALPLPQVGLIVFPKPSVSGMSLAQIREELATLVSERR